MTPAGLDPAFFTSPGGFGLGSIVTDPGHPTDMYVGGYGTLFKSTDYGLTWKALPSKPNPGYQALGHVVAVAGTTPATVWVANGFGDQHVYKSIDAGLTFTLTGTVPGQSGVSGFYSIVVDPNDSTHLITGLHEADKVLESNDGGATWHFASGNGWPSSGISWFPYFVNTGDPATTSKTWFAIAQDGGSAIMTRDGGKTWAVPKGIENLMHPHGSSGFFQLGNTLFVAGVNAPGGGDAVFRSNDLGLNWTRVASGTGAIVWGSSKNVYAMWGWACSGCGLNEGGTRYQTAAWPGDTWKAGTVPADLVWGPNSIATTSDGTHNIYVGSMWATGLWRYVEP